MFLQLICAFNFCSIILVIMIIFLCICSFVGESDGEDSRDES